jgi:hypothetical protein
MKKQQQQKNRARDIFFGMVMSLLLFGEMVIIIGPFYFFGRG